MHAVFHPEADEEFTRALAYYHELGADLGDSFLGHIENLVAEIRAKPTLYRIFRRPSARRHHRRGFPYAVVYVIKPDHIWIIAVMHFKQRPDYWVHRLDS
jgi:hypothetical protein